ncbi:hypothetical protein [Chlamydia abortus]|uniref:Conserved hypothetical membrane protein n=1 Tax=Chlamydia abortus (strain DSM 27085 / S26/3) TaxID=218497 RepID=Q5L5S5_CHLAB|nr:hypothetical protein [Chlamydia abortus]ASD30709.1 hypothetical protein CEF07_02975 [Chlamydia abortus]AUS60036.1 putative membrane protein [Chlamydia abortus]QRR31343.1 hypothetical protein JS522_02945 [Chlamydia abortus]CAH64013.1 conserved hypothetical membrane protein [Chlamydia abortus S26/3]CED80618.1 conserved hypothetical membrane protein [Chlamydia abortus]
MSFNVTLPLSHLPAPELDYTLLSSEQKLTLYGDIRRHRCQGGPLVVVGTLAFIFALVLVLIGSCLLGYPLQGLVFVSDIFLPFLLPGCLLFVLIAAPLMMYAFQYHKAALSKHKQLAESNYVQILHYCNSQTGKITKKDVAGFIASQVLLVEYTPRFSFVTLLQTLKVIPEKDSSRSSLHDSLIAEGVDRAKEDIYASEYDKEKRDRLEAEEEARAAEQRQEEEASLGVSPLLT